MDALGSVSSSPTSLSLFKNGGNTSSLRTPLRGGRRREERRWTVHSKCCSTGSACPVAIGHRVSIQQEMLKERHSDLLGELCLFASAELPQDMGDFTVTKWVPFRGPGSPRGLFWEFGSPVYVFGPLFQF